MRLLSRSALLLLLVAGAASQTIASPPAQSAHGIDEQTFHTLWSGDIDDSEEQLSSGTDYATLAATTDIPFDNPPAAVERWNRGDLQEFPVSGPKKSVSPQGATLEDGRYIKDAYTAVFAVHPSTRARIQPDWRPLQVAPAGDVLGTVDYRVAVPTDDTRGDRRVYWSLMSHEIAATRLQVDDTVETQSAGSHTPSLSFSNLDAYRGNIHTLALEATITVQFRKRIVIEREHCEMVPVERAAETNVTGSPANTTNTTDSPTNNTPVTKEVRQCWTTTGERVEQPTETLTVRDEIDVLAYDFAATGYRARYPNGDLGLEVHTNRPWRSYTLSDADVHGAWRFYTARDSQWDQLRTSTATGTQTRASPLQPLQVNAYPIEGGATASPYGQITFLDVYGAVIDAPSLPQHVNLDHQVGTYLASYGIATRSETSTRSAVTATGLVRGMRVELTEDQITEVPINRSDLTLSVVDRTPETVTVEVRLQDAATDAPINTRLEGGHVLLKGEKYETSSLGTVRATVPRSDQTITARYEPGQWWQFRQGYVGDSDTVHTRGTVLQFLDTLFGLAVPVLLFLLAGFIIDRVTGWHLWPPWRGL